MSNKTTLIIVRHGNTFTADQTPTRVGARTDLPLVEEKRGRAVGKYLKANGLIPDKIYSSPLKRCVKTAELAISEIGVNLPIENIDSFREIDYGPDENKTEDEVLMRLGNGNPEVGKKIIEDWNCSAVVPQGWIVDPQKIINTWKKFCDDILVKNHGQKVMLVSSNGIIRFAPYITGSFEEFSEKYDIKVATGSVSVFEYDENESKWICLKWNEKPYKLW